MNTTIIKKRGGARPGTGGARAGAGRKPADNAMTASIVVRCHPEQRDYFNQHMGAEWLRKMVDEKRGV